MYILFTCKSSLKLTSTHDIRLCCSVIWISLTLYKESCELKHLLLSDNIIIKLSYYFFWKQLRVGNLLLHVLLLSLPAGMLHLTLCGCHSQSFFDILPAKTCFYGFMLYLLFAILECFHLVTKSFVLDVFFMLFITMTGSSILLW